MAAINSAIMLVLARVPGQPRCDSVAGPEANANLYCLVVQPRAILGSEDVGGLFVVVMFADVRFVLRAVGVGETPKPMSNGS